MDGSTSSPNAGSSGTSRLPGLQGTQSEKQLTPRELAALRKIKRNVDVTKYGGWMLGAAGTYVLVSRRKPPPRMLSRLGWSFVGGLGGSFLTMPIGILMSRGALQDVEDPQHLRKVLVGAMEEQRQGRKPQFSVAPPKGLDGEQDAAQPEWGGERAAQTEAASFDSTGNLRGSGGSDSFDSFSSPQAGAGARNERPNVKMAPTEAAGGDDPPPGMGAGTRWAQLRGERSVEPSKWERIRQDNARNAYTRSNSAQAEPSRSEPQGDAAGGAPAAPPRASRPSTRARDEPVMTLSGAEDDPRWSSPASFSPQSSGWGSGEFLNDPAGGGDEASRRGGGARRTYGIHSVDEERTGGFQIESDAPVQVVKGALLTTLAGGVYGSVYGVLRGRQGAGTILGTRMAMSTFAFAFPFFAVREYVVSPVLNRTSSGPDPANRQMRLRTVAPNRHTHNLLASGLAGAVVGAGAAAFTRGPAAIHKGIVTFGVACTALQLAGNETRIVRDALLRPAPRAAPMVAQQPTAEPAVAASQGVPTMVDAAEASEMTPEREDKPKGSWLSKVKNAMPIRSVSDEEYEEKLNKRLTSVNQRMADVETEIREIEALLQQKEQTTPPAS